MSNPFLGEIRMFGCNFAPRGWATCNGQIMAISQNTALFSLLGTQYGGNGQTTFGLPDLGGRVPINQGQGPGLSNRVIGEEGGSEAVALTTVEVPSHTHLLSASSSRADRANASGAVLADSKEPIYNFGSPNAQLAPNAIAPMGGSQPHNNVQPYLVINFCIALAGIFPSRQ
jgi:microcystin-dependent protein